MNIKIYRSENDYVLNVKDKFSDTHHHLNFQDLLFIKQMISEFENDLLTRYTELNKRDEKSFDISIARQNAKPYITPNPIETWHEDIGPCLWWKFPVEEEPYVGSPLDLDFPSYVTHYTPIFIPTISKKEEV